MQKKSLRMMLAASCLAVLLALPGCGQAADAGKTDTPEPKAQISQAETVDFVDDAGRTVTIPGPTKVERVYYTSPMGQIACFTMDPKKCSGTTIPFTEQELKYLPAGTENLPQWGSKKKMNFEELIKNDVQLIVDVAPNGVKDSDASKADKLQEQANIPVVVLDGAMDKVPALYTHLGEIFGEPERAAELGDYCAKVYKDDQDSVASIPEDKRVSIYYAEGPEGLNTEPADTMHSMVFTVAGAKNVAVDVEGKGGKGKTPVSLEQVINWNPDVIFAWSADRGGAADLIKSSADWSSIAAVESGRVYTMPQAPFSWLDRPPSVNRFIGLQWVANTLYPEAYKVDMVKTTQEFYKLFYHVDITAEQAQELLGNSLSK